MNIYVKIGTWPAGVYEVVRKPIRYSWLAWTKRSLPSIGDRCVVLDNGREIPLLIDGKSGELLLAQQH